MSMLVIASVVLAIGISVSLLSISEGQVGLSQSTSEGLYYLVDACAEEALTKLRETTNLPSSISIPELTCSLSVDSQSGNNWLFTVEGSVDNYTKKIQIAATRDTSVVVTDWKEVE